MKALYWAKEKLVAEVEMAVDRGGPLGLSPDRGRAAMVAAERVFEANPDAAGLAKVAEIVYNILPPQDREFDEPEPDPETDPEPFEEATGPMPGAVPTKKPPARSIQPKDRRRERSLLAKVGSGTLRLRDLEELSEIWERGVIERIRVDIAMTDPPSTEPE